MNDWFKDKGLPTYYTIDSLEFELPPLGMVRGFDSSAFFPIDFAALGETDYLSHSLYFDISNSAKSLDTLRESDSLQLYSLWRQDSLQLYLDSLRLDSLPPDSLQQLDSLRLRLDSLRLNLSRLDSLLSNPLRLYSLRLHTDSLFYSENGDKLPVNNRVTAKFSWAIVPKVIDSTSRFLSLPYSFSASAEVPVDLNIRAAKDSVELKFPQELIDEYLNAKDSIHIILKVDLSGGGILRLSYFDIYGLNRTVAQKTILKGNCATCLYSGIADSLILSFSANEIRGKLKEHIKDSNKTVILAQILQATDKSGETKELEHPDPVYVRSLMSNAIPDTIPRYFSESYVMDTAFVKEYGHPRLVFGNDALPLDTLKLQVSRAIALLASGVALKDDSLKFVLRFEHPMLSPKAIYSEQDSKIFADRQSYSCYDFSKLFNNEKPAIVRVWFAVF